MVVEKLTPNDERIQHGYADAEGHRWHYLDVAPEGPLRGVIFLAHGFPDLSFGWRYQIPMLTKLGLRCIAIDCMGYGETGVSPNAKDYSYKFHADAIVGIAKHLGVSNIILGGHDWGGIMVYRIAQWYPDLVTHVFSVCTPYVAPSKTFIPSEILVAGPLKNFAYQLQFGSEDEKIEKVVKDEPSIRKFLIGMYGGQPASGKQFKINEKGVDLSIITSGEEIGMTPLLNAEELDFYVAQFCKTGMKGPCNWYRNRRTNYEDELNLPESQSGEDIKHPTLFIAALDDAVLKPELSVGMEQKIPNLSRGEVKAGHWALWQTPAETNAIIEKWFEEVVFGGKLKV